MKIIKILALVLAVLLMAMAFAEQDMDELGMDLEIDGAGQESAEGMDGEVIETEDGTDLDLAGDLVSEEPEAPATVAYRFTVNGEEYAAQAAVEGEEIVRPADPEAAEGMAFAGWILEDGAALFTDADGDGEIDPVIAHIDPQHPEVIVTAKFVEKEEQPADQEPSDQKPSPLGEGGSAAALTDEVPADMPGTTDENEDETPAACPDATDDADTPTDEGTSSAPDGAPSPEGKASDTDPTDSTTDDDTKEVVPSTDTPTDGDTADDTDTDPTQKPSPGGEGATASAVTDEVPGEDPTQDQPADDEQQPADDQPADEQPQPADQQPADDQQQPADEQKPTDEQPADQKPSPLGEGGSAAALTDEVVPPLPNELTYTGEAQALVSAEGAWLYSLDGESYSADLPAAVDAGEYTVFFKAAEDAEAQSLTVTVAKADVVFTPPTAATGEE